MAITSKMVETIKNQLLEISEKLEEYKDKKQEVLDNEERKDSPNDERVGMLSSQIETLEDAYGYVQEAVDELENYE